MKKIFFLIDGIADSFANSPLRLSRKKFIDSKLKNSFLASYFPTPKFYWKNKGNEASISGLAVLSILGYKVNIKHFRRGPYEAIGNDIKFKNGWLAIRIDFATVDENFKVINRRCGRNEYGIKKLVDDINHYLNFNVNFQVYHTIGHRGVLIFKEKLSPYVSDSDPYCENKKVKKIRALRKDGVSIKTAKILQNFLDQTHNFLKSHRINLERSQLNIPVVNYLLTRQAGNKILKLKKFFEKKSIAITENGVIKGVCKSLGFKIDEIKNTEDINSEIKSVKKKILKNYKDYNFLLIHLKKADEAGHDKNFKKKKEFFEKFDKLLKEIYRDTKDSKIIITGDHITDTKFGKHLFGPVPILIINSDIKNNPKEFSEKEALKFKINNIWKYIND